LEKINHHREKERRPSKKKGNGSISKDRQKGGRSALKQGRKHGRKKRKDLAQTTETPDLKPYANLIIKGGKKEQPRQADKKERTYNTQKGRPQKKKKKNKKPPGLHLGGGKRKKGPPKKGKDPKSQGTKIKTIHPSPPLGEKKSLTKDPQKRRTIHTKKGKKDGTKGPP